jgi:hypothetical protein
MGLGSRLRPKSVVASIEKCRTKAVDRPLRQPPVKKTIHTHERFDES